MIDIDALSESVPTQEEEYIGVDGLLHCKRCGGKTQTRVTFLGVEKTVRCVCRCVTEKREAEKEREKKEEYDRVRRVCFSESNMHSWTFENDDRSNEKISDAMQRYADSFDKYRKDGKGLLLYGGVGTGKTFYAASIANRIIDKGYSALMTNFARVANAIGGTFEKNEYIDDLNRYSLLILDDLGAERSSDYMLEMVFNIIDSRYRAGKPFIVTTNLTAEQLKKPEDIRYSRIYDRILERCLPVSVDGQSRRRKNLAASITKAREELGL